MGKKRETAETAHERGYITGITCARLYLLGHLLRELYADEVESPEVTIARLRVQLDTARMAIRAACEEFGDNDWPDDLHLGDAVEKHLLTYLRRSS